MSNKITVATHNSSFHTDDIFAVATLLLLLEKDNIVEVIRSRDEEITNKADYLVDFGGIHDPSRNRFDHHQPGGAGKRENGIGYASFGLVWKEYGEKICGNLEVAKRIDKIIVQPVDFVDADPNGLEIFETKIKDLRPFDIGMVHLFFTPTWKEDMDKIDEIFLTLVSYAKTLISRLVVYINDEVEGEKIVLDEYHQSKDKRLIIISNSKLPWLITLSQLPEPLYVVYQNPKNDTWSIKCVRGVWSYKTRKDLPESWAGKRDLELEKVTGVPGSVFCHNARFMAVAKTREAVLKMAEIALNQ